LPVNVPAFLPSNKRDDGEREDERVSSFVVLRLIYFSLLDAAVTEWPIAV
jgi:hypothetical protein